ncbi:aquaporin 1 [Pelomyxa schiedti]|nr:aquaporin 1 [Pelomyxa schiedti]
MGDTDDGAGKGLLSDPERRHSSTSINDITEDREEGGIFESTVSEGGSADHLPKNKHPEWLRTLVKLWRPCVAEFIGTLLLVFVGCGSVTSESRSLGGIQVCMTFASTLAALIMTFDTVSGGHFNPAVTFAFALLRKTKVIRAICYLFCQCLGAIAGAALVYLTVPDAMNSYLGANVCTIEGWKAYILETLCTGMFVFVILMMALHPTKPDNKRLLLPLAVWCVIISMIFFIGPLTGCSLNPARSLGPAIVANYWDYQYIYWAGPLSGSIVAAALYFIIFLPH